MLCQEVGYNLNLQFTSVLEDSISKMLCLKLVSSVTIFVTVGLLTLETSAGKHQAKEEIEDLKTEGSSLDYLKAYSSFATSLSLIGQQLFAPLGLTPHQSYSIMMVLLNTGLINPTLFPPGFPGAPAPLSLISPIPPPTHQHLVAPGFGLPFAPHPDPFLTFYVPSVGKYNSYGLGQYGIFGSNSLQNNKPPGVFKHTKN